MSQPSFPDVIDSSLLSAWRSCRRKVFLEYFQHWKPVLPNVHLHAGASFAHGLEVTRKAFYEEGLSADEAIGAGFAALMTRYGNFACPEDSAKSASSMAGALEYYFHAFPLDTDNAKPTVLPSGKRGIEFSFLEPIDVNHPVTGDPILYAGRFDMIADYAGGRWGEDDKTTSSLGASWGKQWDLRSQFTAYCWGALRGGLKLNGFLVRGVSILKTKYDTAEVMTHRPQWMIDEWYEATLADVREMVATWQSGYWRKALDNACNEYGGCLFKQICTSNDPQRWLAVNFQRRRWDPVSREETLLEVPV